MNHLKYLWIVLSLLFFLPACNQEEVEERMVQFDRAFIPVWYYVQIGRFAQAELALKHFEAEWKDFKRSSLIPISNHRKEWKQSVAQMDQWLADSRCAIDEKDIELAINQLDHARYEMIDWRWRAQINYFLDYVWDLEASIDVVYSTAVDPMLNLLEWGEFQQVNKDLRVSWERLQLQNPDPGLFDFSEADFEEYLLRQDELAVIINAYLKESLCMDTCEYEEAGESLRYAFLSYLKLFGDFEMELSLLAEQE